MVNAGSVTQAHQKDRFGPLPVQNWRVTVTVPATATSITVTSPNALGGTVTEVWIDPATLTAAANIKVYWTEDTLTTPNYISNYTVPNPAVETHSAINARTRGKGTLTCAVTSATAGDSFVMVVVVDPNADDNLNVVLGDLSVDIDADTLLLMGARAEGTSVATTPSGVLLQGDTGGSDNKAKNVAVDSAGNVIVTGKAAAGTADTGVLTVQGIASMTPLLATGTGTAGTAATGVVTVQGIASGTAQTVAVLSGGVASGGIASGAVASGAVASGAVASGALASGSVADGAMVTLGAMANDKSSATDTTAITAMSILKELSYLLQNPLNPVGLATVATGENAGSVTAVQLATVAAKFVRLKALASNVGVVCVGSSNAVTLAAGTTDTTSGFELSPGDDTGWLPATNLNLFWIICTAATDDLSYMVMV
jgi:hypothetical protein